MNIYDWTKGAALDGGLIRRQGKDTPYLRGGGFVPLSGKFSPLDKEFVVDGKISLSNSGIVKKGSNALSITNAGFAYVAENPFVDSVTLFWDGTNGSKVPTVNRSSGSAQAVPAGNIKISGLLPNTTYYVLPYWSNQNPCSLGFALGTVGTPQICFTDTSSLTALLQQNLQQNDPLTNGFASFATPGTGGSGGGGTGGGGTGTCVMLGTDIETLDDIEHTETLLPCTEWWHVCVRGGASLFCTPDHPLYDEHGFRKPAKELKVGDWVTMQYGTDQLVLSEAHRRVCTKVVVTMPRVHLYWANRFLSHNFKPAGILGAQGGFYVNGA